MSEKNVFSVVNITHLLCAHLLKRWCVVETHGDIIGSFVVEGNVLRRLKASNGLSTFTISL